MAKSNMALPVVCAVLGLHILVSLVLKSIKLNDIRVANANAVIQELALPFTGVNVHNPVSDVVLLVVAALCLLKCCSGKPTPGAMKGVCVVTAVLMLIRGFPELLLGMNVDKDSYLERLVYGITGIVNAVVAVTCCC